jgi:hypothetical protein
VRAAEVIRQDDGCRDRGFLGVLREDEVGEYVPGLARPM